MKEEKTMNKKDIRQLPISDTDVVKVIPTKRNVDIRYTLKTDTEQTESLNSIRKESQPVKRLTKETYLDPATNSIRTYRQKEKRTENESTFYRTKRELNWLILNSFEGKENELFITLTYKEQMQDYEMLGKDFRNFMRRLSRHFKEEIDFDYIVVREPHLSGSWHMHVLMKYSTNTGSAAFQSSNREWTELITEKWQKGIVHISPITEVNQLAVYLTRHLMDIAIDDNGEEIELFADSLSPKSFAKNKRLELYPQHLKIYSYSKRIEKPRKLYMTYAECKEIYEETHEKNWDNSMLLFDDHFALQQRHIQLTLKE